MAAEQKCDCVKAVDVGKYGTYCILFKNRGNSKCNLKAFQKY